MLTKIAHYNDGKGDPDSHRCNLMNVAKDYSTTDITDFCGYGETKEEAIKDMKKQLEPFFNEIEALRKMLYETDVLDNDVIEVNCLWEKI
nr:MAG TPA: putative ligand binding protein [Caudoviricetes sp.]